MFHIINDNADLYSRFVMIAPNSYIVLMATRDAPHLRN